MKINDYLCSLLATSVLLIPCALLGQTSDSEIYSVPEIPDSVATTPRGDTVFYYKPYFFDFGETYKGQNQPENNSVSRAAKEARLVTSTSSEMEGIDMTKYVGQIPYTHSATPTGGKMYTVPIETAVTNGIKPQVAISYNSQSGNGLLGMGWSLSGLSAIMPVNKSIYYDEVTSAPVSTASDVAFALDGMRLVPSQKLEGYPLETAQGQILVQPVYSTLREHVVKYFVVLHPNGTKAMYGTDVEKTQTDYSYPLLSLEDSKGYRIDFEYQSSHGKVDVVSKIKYGGRDANSHPSYLQFQYMNRNDIPEAFVLGQSVVMDRLLTKITSYNDGKELRTYTLTYDLNNVYQLAKIDCSVDDVSLNPLKFKYGEEFEMEMPDELSKKSEMLLSTYFSSTSDMVYQRGRFYKDDYNEGIVVYPNLPNYGLLETYTFMFLKSYKYGSKFRADQAILIAPRLSTLSNVQTIYAGEGFQQLTCADVDGDGVDEFVQLNIYATANGYCVLKITTHRWTSSGFSSDEKLYAVDGVVSDGPYFNPIARAYYFGDFDGDGKMELLTISYNSSYKGDIRTSIFSVIDLDTGNVLYSRPCFSYGTENSNYVYILDYDGDGKSDVCHIGTNAVEVYSFAKNQDEYCFEKICSDSSLKLSHVKGKEVHIADYNGDGKQDLVVLPEQSSYYSRPLRVYEFDQGCVEAYVEMQPNHEAYMSLRENYPGSRYRLWVCSVNKNSYYVDDLDRTEDILYVDKGDLWEIYLSRGEGSFKYKPLHFERTQKNMKYVIMDVNKDGFPDVLQKHNCTVSVYLNKNGAWESIPDAVDDSFSYISRILPTNLCNYGVPTDILMVAKETLVAYSFTQNESRNRLLTGMTDSYGLRHTNYYSEMTSREIYNPGKISRTYPYNNLMVPLNLIDKASVYNPTEGRNVYQERYQYQGAVIHRTGLGFCGFAKMEVCDEISGHTTVDERDPEMFGVSVRTISPLVECSYVYQNNSVGKCTNLLVTNVTEFNKLTGDTIVKSYQYDDFGNPVKEVVRFAPTIKTVTVQTYDNVVTQERYMLGLPRIKRVTRTRDADSWEESEEVSYNSMGLPIQKVSTVAGGQVEKLKWGYDSYGNLRSEESTPFDAIYAVRNFYIYDGKGRYLAKKQDPLGRETNYTVYNKYGIATEVIDVTAHKTYYDYDQFGRLWAIAYPDGRVTTTVYHWDTSIGLYVATQETTGEATQKTYYDILDREIQTATQRFDGSWQYVRKEYDRRGRLSRVSLPFKSGEAINWTTYGYDNYDRQTSIVESSGKTTTIAYSQNRVTVQENGITKVYELDATGLPVKVTDPAGSITYVYRADGQLKAVTAPGNIVTTFEYDVFGRRNKIVDPSGGTQTTREYYSGYNRFVEQTDANGKTVTYKYDPAGRILQQNREDLNTAYSYDSDVLELTEIASANHSKEYAYDSMARVIHDRETAPDGRSLQRDYTYILGNITKIVYRPSWTDVTATEERIYTNGYLTEIKLNNTSVWKLIEENELGQPVKVVTGPLTRTYGYDEYGIPTTRKVDQLLDFSYSFDSQTGNLLSRTDKTRNITEQFSYDHLNRLIAYGDKTVEYDIKGNVVNMSQIGSFSYGHPSKPYAVTDVVTTGDLVSRRAQTVIYGSLQRPTVVSTNFNGNNYALKFDYDENGERIKRESLFAGSRVRRYYLSGCCETETTGKSLLYIGGDAYTAPVVFVEKDGSWDIYYICRDYLGSITHVAKSSGELEQELSYDAWGRLRNPENQTVYTLEEEPVLFLGRGYTGHEHLREIGLINMNARLYDPAIGRFLSPDPFVQIPDNSQNFNRYSYCLNNPLAYTDPSGEWFLIDDLIVGVAGFIMGYVAHGVTANDWGWNAVASGGIGAVSSWLSFNTMGANISAWGFVGNSAVNTVWGSIYPSLDFSAGDFSLSISPIAIFTGGVAKEGGFRFGISVSASYQMGDWTLSGGFGATSGGNYEMFGLGYDDGDFGFSWHRTNYIGGAYEQGTGTIGLRYRDWSVKHENDLDVWGGDGGDKFRTAAIEIGYRNYVIGANVFTNDAKRKDQDPNRYKSKLFGSNGKGKYDNSKVYQSPFYIGMKHGKQLTRIGINAPVVQDFTQNGVHKIGKFFYYETPYGEYKNLYFQTGRYYNYSMY